jgi:tetratricopeptide (TPR) repeat protein
MAKEIKTGIALTLKDGFSPAIRRAGEETKSFAGKTLGAVNQIDKAFSGMGAKLAAFGLSFSLGAVTKDLIELDHRMTRIGLTAGAGAEQMIALKKEIFKAARDMKISPAPVVDAVAMVMEKVGDLEFTKNNILNIAKAFQATEESGEALGNTFSALANLKFSDADALDFFDRAAAISDYGAFGLASFAKHAEAITAAYASVGTSVEDQANGMKALQIIYKGIGNDAEAVTALQMTLTELRTKQKELWKKGIEVKVSGTDNLRDLNDIMADIVSVIEREGNSDYFYDVFGARAMRVVDAYKLYGKDMAAVFDGMGDASGSLQRRVDTMSKTLKSNIQGLKTALTGFADANLAAPLGAAADALNKLTEHPERVKRLFTEISVGLGAIAAVKGIAGIARVFEGMKGLKNGALNITESLSMAGAMPVYVTNWGGAGFGAAGGVPAGIPGGGTGVGLVDQYGRPVASQPKTEFKPKSGSKRFNPKLKGAMKGAGGAALVSAAISGVGLAVELADIEKSGEMGAAEKAAARGGAGGQFAGDVAGAAAGAVIGTLIMPGVGTMIGGMLGSMLGGKVGRFIGEKLGVTIDKSGAALDAAKAAYESAACELESAVASQKTAAEIEAAGRELYAARAELAEAEAKQNKYDAAKEAAKNAGGELAAAIASGKTAGETADLYQALAGANAEMKAAAAALKAPEAPAKTVKPKGHYEYAGVNGIPVWVEPEIPAAALSAAAVNGVETLAPREPPKALLTGSVDLNVTVDGGKTYVTAKTNTPLVKPNMNNCGNAYYGREIAP